jgi:hypothetical protein
MNVGSRTWRIHSSRTVAMSAGRVLFAMVLGCGASSSGTQPSSAPDGGGARDVAAKPAPDASAMDAPSHREAAADGAPFTNSNVCGAGSGQVAWMASIPSSSPTLNLFDVAIGPTNDAVVADQSGDNYEQRRYSESGAIVSVHQDALGSYAGPITTSNLYVDAANNLFYGALFTGLVDGANSGAELFFNSISPDGTLIANDPHKSSMPTSKGAPQVLVFDCGGDSGGGLHSAFTMGGPQYFAPGVYCYGSNGSFSGISAPAVTATMFARDFEWPNAAEGMYITKRVTAAINLGCGALSVPTEGGMVLAQLDTGGNCVWNKLLRLPTAAILANDFRLGADGSLAVLVVYSGSIDFGGGTLTSSGKSSLGVALYDATGGLLFSKSFGGSDSSFVKGSLGVNSSGTLMVSAGYAGTVDLGGGPLPSTDDTFVATFDGTGHLNWGKTVAVGANGKWFAAIGPCGITVATNSTTADLGTGSLSSKGASGVPSIGVAAIGL